MQNRQTIQNVFAIDFDGVLCDSAGEAGTTAWRAGGRLWPDWQGPEPPAAYLGRFRKLRPVIETGYQAVLLMRLIHDSMDDETIEREFSERCARIIEERGCSSDDVARLVSQARSDWIDRDVDDWLGRHSFYPGVLDAFTAKAEHDPVFILTTKEERFVRTLIDSRAIRLPGSHIFGLDTGRSKEDILDELSQRPAFREARFHFVEDRLQTLMRVASRSSLDHILLYLAGWGYTTDHDREQARAIPRITVWNAASFLDV
ncbi:MAG TPA: haloacid dehalogenase [Nitrospiraceae bacterium]|nr:haloacid dehalogenase [Nitrospiraceae bacterium]